MTFQEFTKKFKRHIATLSYQKQIDLAIEICKKLFFDYEQFSTSNNWGNSDLIIDTIKFIEDEKNSRVDKVLLKERINQVEIITPDTEDFGDAGYALNCCVAVCETLDFLTDHNPEHIYIIGTCFTDTVDARIQEDVDLDEIGINTNPEIIAARNYLLEWS